jgi:hypothetical protein
MHHKTVKFAQCKCKHLYLKFVEVFLCGGNNKGQSSVLISIKCTGAFCLYICIDVSLNDKVHGGGGEGREREGDTMSERGRGIQRVREGRERGIDEKERGERGEGRERERGGEKEREREGEGEEEESERGVEHQIHIFYVRGGYFQGSSNYFRFCKARLRFLV